MAEDCIVCAVFRPPCIRGGLRQTVGWMEDNNPASALDTGLSPRFLPAMSRACARFALLPNLGPRESGVFRLAQVRWAGFTG